ncbi:MAG: glycosyltransferase family 4 protein [Spirochaetales bacterium]|nr:glycosyltransferase family 4 protein [Spirochaetales bacterium]
MTVLMLCWEFPPFIAGGLGVACHGIVKALLKLGIKIDLFLPARFPLYFRLERPENADNLEPVFFLKRDEINFRRKKFLSYRDKLKYLGLIPGSGPYLYNNGLMKRVINFKETVSRFAHNLNFDIIHAHDWLTFPAALFLKQRVKKPFTAHIHSTEFDRSCGGGNELIKQIEYAGLTTADLILAVSGYTKSILAGKYGIEENKIHIAYNAYSLTKNIETGRKTLKEPLVMFLGRLTEQKGPQYFLLTAEKVLKKLPGVTFVVAGEGNYKKELVKKAEEYRIQDKVLFTGFLERDEVANFLSAADILLMPSVSEPFGIAALEAIEFGTAVITSRSAGITEVSESVYKTDFWDTDTMAGIIINLLKNPEQLKDRIDQSKREIENISWDKTAQRIVELYLDITKSL